jgi:translocation and assembly module TamB
VVHLIVSSSGENNLPSPQSSANSSTNIFDLKIGHVLLDHGEVYYNDRKSALDANLHDLQFQSNYDATAGGRYSGSLSYRNGWVHFENYSALEHDLQAQFDARREGLTLSNVVLKSGESQALLDASLQNYTNPTVQSKYVITLATANIKRFLNDSSVPAGTIVVNGTANYTNIPGRAPLDAITLEGTLISALLRVSTPTVRTDIHDLEASFSLTNGNVDVRDIHARLLGGSLTGTATVRDLSGKQEGHLTAALHNISLADLKALARSQSLTPVVISGRANARADATWRGGFNDLIARADATANGSISSSQQNQETGALPIEAQIRGRYAGATKELSLDQSYVHTPQTSITANGTVSRRSVLRVRATSNDLHEVEAVAGIFSKPSQPLDLHGSAAFNGTVQGSVAALQIAGQLSASNLQIHGTAFRVVRANVEASPSLVKLQNGYLELAQQGHANFNMQTGLQGWSYTPASQFVLNVAASQLSVTEIARAAGATVPVTGALNANIDAHGTQLNPVGQGEVTLRNATAYHEPIQLAEIRFQGTGDEVHANLTARITAGTAEGQITYLPKQQGYNATLKAANIHLEQIQALKDRNIQAAGTLNLNATGRGTLQDPQAQLSVTIPQLDIQKQQVRNVNLQAHVANRNATFALDSQVLNNPLHAQGKVALNGDYYADVRVDTPVMPLQPLLAAYSPTQAANLSGQTEVHATLRGPLKKMALLEAHLDVPTFVVAYRTTAVAAGAHADRLELAAVSPIRADYADGVLTLQPGEAKGTDTDLHFQGRVPITSNTSSTLKLNGFIDLSLAQIFDPTLTGRGQVQLDINAGGHTFGEDLAGQVRIVNASFSTPDMPVGISNGNGVLTVRGNRLDITQLTADAGGGQVSASGGITYRPNVQFNIGLKGNGLQLLYPQTVRSHFDLNLALTGTPDSALLQGQINVDRISFTPDFDLSTFANQFSGVSTPPPTQGFADNLRLNIALRSLSQLNVVNPTLSLQGDANLRVIGTAADPVIVGRASVNGGDLIFLGNRYVLQSGTIAFVNTMETQPVINLQATTTVQQYNINLRFHGPLDRLQTNYTSDPALPPADIIHLLAFGTTEEAANAAPATSTTLGAESLIASQVTSQITNRVQKVAGISQLSVDPQLSNNGNQQPGARITVQQRVTSKLFVTFTTDVTTSEDTAVQMQYQINRKWSVSGVRDWSRGFGIDGRYHKDF